MLKIRNVEFKEKFTEINIRQRMYQGKSYITLMVVSEFYPSLIGKQIVSGTIEAKIDMEDISCIDDLVGKKLNGEIGSVTISVNNDGIWEHQSFDNFVFEIIKRNGRELSFILSTEEGVLDINGVMVSLYTTSTSKEELSKVFSLSDFYSSVVEKEIGKQKVFKYFVKECD